MSLIQCQGKHGIHFSLDLKYKVNTSSINGVPLATDNKIVVRHRLFTPTLNSTFQHYIANDLATLRQHSGSNSGTVGTLRRRIRILRIGFSFYTATFRMPLRECMRIHAELPRWQSFAHILISDTEMFPTLYLFYRQPYCNVSGL